MPRSRRQHMEIEKSWAPERWDLVFAQRSEWSKYPSENVIRFVARNWYNAADRKRVRLLDLGSGPGSNTWYMAREGFSVSAVDGSPQAMALLRARLRGDRLTAELKVADYVKLPWPNDFFDGAIDHASIMHNPHERSRRI